MIRPTIEKSKDDPKRRLRVLTPQTEAGSDLTVHVHLREELPIENYQYLYPLKARAFGINPIYPDDVKIEDPSLEAERSYDEVLQRMNMLEERLLTATKVEGTETLAKLHEARVEIKSIKDTLVSKSELTIIDAFKESPKKNIEIVCVCLISLMIFSLTISGVFGLHIINPLFAFLSTIGWAGFWMMARFGR
jgi:hypothetical protein